ncbi:hypothetical protein [uncultured Ruegeria sp.]|uniref:hypothetical protein n=1 Tax=uncultured Ruegeria sp. TaxID=259304 RepID=UPI0026371489|nr:hypothetical protein [uncultured Ruegeria sp.]
MKQARFVWVTSRGRVFFKGDQRFVAGTQFCAFAILSQNVEADYLAVKVRRKFKVIYDQ